MSVPLDTFKYSSRETPTDPLAHEISHIGLPLVMNHVTSPAPGMSTSILCAPIGESSTNGPVVADRPERYCVPGDSWVHKVGVPGGDLLHEIVSRAKRFGFTSRTLPVDMETAREFICRCGKPLSSMKMKGVSNISWEGVRTEVCMRLESSENIADEPTVPIYGDKIPDTTVNGLPVYQSREFKYYDEFAHVPAGSSSTSGPCTHEIDVKRLPFSMEELADKLAEHAVSLGNPSDLPLDLEERWVFSCACKQMATLDHIKGVDWPQFIVMLGNKMTDLIKASEKDSSSDSESFQSAADYDNCSDDDDDDVDDKSTSASNKHVANPVGYKRGAVSWKPPPTPATKEEPVAQETHGVDEETRELAEGTTAAQLLDVIVCEKTELDERTRVFAEYEKRTRDRLTAMELQRSKDCDAIGITRFKLEKSLKRTEATKVAIEQEYSDLATNERLKAIARNYEESKVVVASANNMNAEILRKQTELDEIISAVQQSSAELKKQRKELESRSNVHQRDCKRKAEEMEKSKKEISSWFSVPEPLDTDLVEVDDEMAPNCLLCLARAPRLFAYSCGHGPFCPPCMASLSGYQWRDRDGMPKCVTCKTTTKGFIRVYLGGVEARSVVAREEREEAVAKAAALRGTRSEPSPEEALDGSSGADHTQEFDESDSLEDLD